MFDEYVDNDVNDWTDGDPCELCGENGGEYDDVLAEFWDKTNDKSVVAHGQCGIDRGWELA